MFKNNIKSVLFLILLTTACSEENTNEIINNTKNENDKGEITMSEE